MKLDFLRSRLGVLNAPEPPQAEGNADQFGYQLAWLKAILRFLPELRVHYARLGIPEEVIAATLADIGRHVALSRVVLGQFSLDTWRWLTLHTTGALFALGRLQFRIMAAPQGLPKGLGDHVLEIHVPATGGLSPATVQSSLDLAPRFFATYFPQHPVTTGVCTSWLLDPYLAQNLSRESNIAAFARRFTLYGPVRQNPDDAVYFTFRRRNAKSTASLERRTSLERLVIDRIEAGDAWTVRSGYLALR